MPRRRINQVELYYKISGQGDPLVLVHGSWTDHTSWRFVTDSFAENHHVLTYDRRGHSRSQRPDRPGSRGTDIDDLAALLETLGLVPAHVVGSSSGASIALGLAARRPDLVRSVVAHEPPAFGIAEPGSDLEQLIQPVLASMDRVADQLRHGDAEGAATRFVEDIALGTGSWEQLPPETRQRMIANAPTFLDELSDPRWGDLVPPVDPTVATLLTDGDTSPTWLPAVVAELATTAYPNAERHTFHGAGHIPHLTHPTEHVAVVRAFIDDATLARGSRPEPARVSDASV